MSKASRSSQERQQTSFFVDLHMGGIDGLATARVIRAINPDAKVVIVSADAANLPKDRRYRTLSKPFGAQQLNHLLHELNGLPHPLL